MIYKMSFIDEVDNIKIRNAITDWSTQAVAEMSKFQDEWLLRNMERYYGYQPSIEKLKVDNDGWYYQDLQSCDCAFRKILYKDGVVISKITLKPVYLNDYFFHYSIENSDGFKTEGMI